MDWGRKWRCSKFDTMANNLPKPRIDVAKALKLRLQGLSYADIGQTLGGFAGPSVFEALAKFAKLIENPELIQSFRDQEPELLDAVRMRIISSLPYDLDRKGKRALSGYQKVGMYGILFDKTRLLRGESTVNLNSLSALVIGVAKDIARGKTVRDITPEASDLPPGVDVAARSGADPASGISQETDPPRIEDVSEGKGK